MCWIDIQEFKSIPDVTENYRISKALHIYNKYIKYSAPLRVGDLLDRIEMDIFDQVQCRSLVVLKSVALCRNVWCC